MKRKIGLIATARTKGHERSRASLLYESPLFRKTIAYASHHYDASYLFSAKHNLLHPDDYIDPYDVSIRTFSKKQRQYWATTVIEQLSNYESPDNVTIYLHGGTIYRDVLEPLLVAYGFNYHVPLKGLGIGAQLAWLNKQSV